MVQPNFYWRDFHIQYLFIKSHWMIILWKWSTTNTSQSCWHSYVVCFSIPNTHSLLVVLQIIYMILVVQKSECMYVRISVWVKIVGGLRGLAGGLRKFSNNPCLVLVLILNTSFLLHKTPLEEVLQLLIGIWLLFRLELIWSKIHKNMYNVDIGSLAGSVSLSRSVSVVLCYVLYETNNSPFCPFFSM